MSGGRASGAGDCQVSTLLRIPIIGLIQVDYQPSLGSNWLSRLNPTVRRAMFALLLIGAVLTLCIGVPAVAFIVRWIIRRPLTPKQLEQDELVRARRRDALYFWR